LTGFAHSTERHRFRVDTRLTIAGGLKICTVTEQAYSAGSNASGSEIDFSGADH
jgi:hypothetical protein